MALNSAFTAPWHWKIVSATVAMKTTVHRRIYLRSHRDRLDIINRIVEVQSVVVYMDEMYDERAWWGGTWSCGKLHFVVKALARI